MPAPTFDIGVLLEGKGALRQAAMRRLAFLPTEAAVVISVMLPAKIGLLAFCVSLIVFVATLKHRVHAKVKLRSCADALQFAVNHANKATERIFTSHEQAAVIIQNFETSRVKFVLSLRSFGLDGVERRFGIGEGSEYIQTNLRESLKLQARYLKEEAKEKAHRRVQAITTFDTAEDLLGASIAKFLPIIGVWNDSTASPNYQTSRIPRLYLPRENWKPALRRAITCASSIVVHLSEMSPGVRYELETILELGREADTIVVISDGPSVDRFLVEILESITGQAIGNGVTYEPVRASDVLARFPHIVEYSTIDLSNLSETEALARILVGDDA
ncbi:MAG TPA: hypothetical protein VGX25_12495 [Actinophytocola sp.]|uniref:hypothetical protein n=1 Tax=Actinophytocola sp. TaxID=1872138 RepID=UPI002DDD1C02|nr:hypothetical protein [Actinophytocola sp.]HEV2780203.1 hypothetical protein [Actinophytocola sp.]